MALGTLQCLTPPTNVPISPQGSIIAHPFSSPYPGTKSTYARFPCFVFLLLHFALHASRYLIWHICVCQNHYRQQNRINHAEPCPSHPSRQTHVSILYICTSIQYMERVSAHCVDGTSYPTFIASHCPGSV